MEQLASSILPILELYVAHRKSFIHKKVFLFAFCLPTNSNLISFANDTQIYTKIHDVSDCNLLQQDLNHI